MWKSGSQIFLWTNPVSATCFFFPPLLTSRSFYSTSLIQFAVHRFAFSLNIAFTITFMSTWGFRRCGFFLFVLVWFFFSSWAELLYMLYYALCGAVLQSVRARVEASRGATTTSKYCAPSKYFFTWRSEKEPCWEPGVGIHCRGVPWEVWALLWSAEELFTAQSLSDELLKIAELITKKTL